MAFRSTNDFSISGLNFFAGCSFLSNSSFSLLIYFEVSGNFASISPRNSLNSYNEIFPSELASNFLNNNRRCF